MAIDGFEIEKLLREAFPTATIQVDDLAGDRNHYSAVVTAQEFQGLTRIKQHQLVYSALKNELASESIHALALKTEPRN